MRKWIALGLWWTISLSATAQLVSFLNFDPKYFTTNGFIVSLVPTNFQAATPGLNSVLTNSVSTGAGPITNLNIIGSNLSVTGAVSSGQANIGIIGPTVVPGYYQQAFTNVLATGTAYTVAIDPTEERTIIIDEEFFNAASGAQQVGQYGWTPNVIASATFTPNPAPATSSDHPGMVQIITTTVAGSGGNIVLGDSGASPTKGVVGDLNTRVPWKFRMGLMISRTNHCQLQAGLITRLANDTVTNITGPFIGFILDTSSGNPPVPQLACLDAGGSSFTNLIGNFSSGVWLDILIRSDTVGVVSCSVNGAQASTNTAHCTGDYLRPTFRYALQGTDSTTTLTIDYFKMIAIVNQRF